MNVPLALHAQARVRLSGLQSHPDLNGHVGIAVRYVNAKCRWEVKLEHTLDTLLLKAENLQLVGIPLLSQLEACKFHFQTIVGRGLGIVANCDIAPGELILSEQPLFLLSAQETMTARADARNVGETLIRERLGLVDSISQECFWSLCDCYFLGGEKTAFGIWQTNAIATGVDSASTQNGLYLKGCRFNHSCRPNVNRCWIAERQVEVFHAVQEIAAGEELCICYIDPTDVFAERRAKLQTNFCFTCTCEACSLTGDSLKASDHRHKEYRRLDKAVQYNGQQDLEELLDLVLQKTDIIQEEFDGDPHLMQRAFYDGFQLALLGGDLETAACWMKRAFEAKILAEGYHAEALQLRAWSEDPLLHPLASGAVNGLVENDEEEFTFCQPCGVGMPPGEIENEGLTFDEGLNEDALIDLQGLD